MRARLLAPLWNRVLTHLSRSLQVVFLEAPTNPLLAVADIANVVRVVKSHPAKPLVVVDATFSSPYYFNPLTHGADVVFHSTTKYIGGHSDVRRHRSSWHPQPGKD